MRYWLEGFGEDEKLVIQYEIPSRLWPLMRQMAGVKPDDDGLGDYEISQKNAQMLVDAIGFDIHPDCRSWFIGPTE